MDELFALSVDTGSKRPGQLASDVAETKRKKENTEVREGGGGRGGRGRWKERGRERGKEREGKGERGWTNCSPSLWTQAARDPDSRPPMWWRPRGRKKTQR